MEASHRTYLSVDPDRSAASEPTGRKDRMIEVPAIDPHDDQRATGFLRLHLMVNAVFERLTRQPTQS